MCGILGGFNSGMDDAALRRLGHRGPDQQKLVALAAPQGGTVTLGQTRLNIVDRHDIGLPVRIGDAVIVFNGQIYNHPELREQLRTHGWTFATQTDIEVALAAYLQWGSGCLSRFNGMFALAIWDGRQVFCARDRLGQKPFYYRARGGSFEFASEIKAFANLRFTSNDLFELFEFCFDEHTLYRDIRALRPGHYMIFDPATSACRESEYWNLEHCIAESVSNEAVAVNAFIELLEDSVRLRMRSDVPVSMFLAGGMDSPLIARFSGVKESFTCQFDEFRNRVNEEDYVLDLAQRIGLRANIVRPTRHEFLTDLGRIAAHLEMPTGSFSVFPLYRLAAAAKGAGYKVILSGEGSDELFGGYVRNELLMAELGGGTEPRSPRETHYAAMLDRYHGSDFERFCRMASRSGLAGAALMKAHLFGRWNPSRTPLQNMTYIETSIFLQPLLQMGDRMCMAHGVENRCPFLDYRLVEFAFSLADSLRVRDGLGKLIVHRAAERLLPRGTKLLKRPVKDGLPTPVNQWLYGSHSFDRKHWNALMTAECIKTLCGLDAGHDEHGGGRTAHDRNGPAAIGQIREAAAESIAYRRGHSRPSTYAVRRAPE